MRHLTYSIQRIDCRLQLRMMQLTDRDDHFLPTTLTTGLFNMNFLGNITIRSRLIFVIAFLSFLLIAGGLIGIISLGFANDSLKTDYENRLVPMSHLDKIIRLTGSSQLAVTLALTEEPAAVAQAAVHDGHDERQTGSVCGQIRSDQIRSDQVTSDQIGSDHINLN